MILDQYHFIVLSVKVFCDADEMVSHKLLRPLNALVSIMILLRGAMG